MEVLTKFRMPLRSIPARSAINCAYPSIRTTVCSPRGPSRQCGVPLRRSIEPSCLVSAAARPRGAETACCSEAIALRAERIRPHAAPDSRRLPRKGDLVMLGIGGFTPLDGFMTRADWEGVCDSYRTAARRLLADPDHAVGRCGERLRFGAGEDIALVDPDDGDALAVDDSQREVRDRQGARMRDRSSSTTDGEHPGVSDGHAAGDVNLAGPCACCPTGGFAAKYGALFMTPAETRDEFERLGWSRVARVPDPQPDAPLARVPGEGRRSRCCDGVLVHSLLGAAQAGRHSRPTCARARSRALIEKYFVPARWSRRATRSTCATPGRAKRCCTPCSARTTAART